MNCIKITPSPLKGSINIPPSKSLSHRAIICAALAKGTSHIENIIFSEDILATLEGMKAFGMKVVDIDTNKETNRNRITIEGKGYIEKLKEIIDCSESGSTLRFLIPIACLLGEKIIFTGKGKLVERPLTSYYKIFDDQGIKYSNDNGRLPLSIEGTLKPKRFELEGNISSQFITGLMFVLPLLSGNSTIEITTRLESKGYIDLTLDMLHRFSINIQNDNYSRFYVPGNQNYAPSDYKVEGDFSQAAFWMAAGTLNGDIAINNLNQNSLQGDKEILNIAAAMGANIIYTDEHIRAIDSQIKGIVIDASQCPDLVPILAVLGALSKGKTKIVNAQRVRIKESDRLKAIASELNKIGADIVETEDGLNINGVDTLNGGVVDSWNDHRIAMALAVASTKCREPLIIKNSNAVNKSYPEFWQDFVRLGGVIDEWNMGK
ncbi:3-phosphoshikimate 1-carboxyvinyltransferase [Proteiniborus sp. MB09-C3]|uniref:3-phosphoshikimate 1-carboxyvinyltransferase n=1 Tax=Proteiniborus sp. MB09-C3 TaxID=3050072 RepID=UPI002554314C|nr:3-phosphoshikimate 1-carboxyvinyltransferase [Proteiniborus sp. MB09-C3]WIV11302.1 3-phosphoshikimate 1-carboxyvinyltransferase [Proteiniborus sp. MB09-C3]